MYCHEISQLNQKKWKSEMEMTLHSFLIQQVRDEYQLYRTVSMSLAEIGNNTQAGDFAEV